MVGVRLMNSTSIVERVIIVYFFDFQVIGQPVKNAIWSLVDIRVIRSSAKLVSLYA